MSQSKKYQKEINNIVLSAQEIEKVESNLELNCANLPKTKEFVCESELNTFKYDEPFIFIPKKNTSVTTSNKINLRPTPYKITKRQPISKLTILPASKTNSVEKQSSTPSENKDPIMELTVMMKAVLRDVKLLRSEINLLRDDVQLLRSEVNEMHSISMVNGNYDSNKPKISLKLPTSSIEEFKSLESDIKLDSDKEKLLLQHLNAVSETGNPDKFTRLCLNLLITDEAACHFSFHGQHQNIAVKSYAVINILKNIVLQKFVDSRAHVVEGVIKKWFQYAKDRHRKKLMAKCNI